MKTYRSHIRMLDERIGGHSRAAIFKLRVRIQYGDAKLERDTQLHSSAADWALTAKNFGIACRFIMHSKDIENTSKILEITTERAISQMGRSLVNCKRKIEFLRQARVDPQVDVLIRPAFKYCVEVYNEWKTWVANGRKPVKDEGIKP